MIGSKRNDSSTIRATPSANGEVRSSRNFSNNSSARSDEGTRAETIDGAAVAMRYPSGSPRNLRSEPQLSSAEPPAVPQVREISFARFRPAVYSCYLARSDREQSVKSWRGWPTRRVPIPSHNEGRGSFSTSSSTTSLPDEMTG